MKTLRQAIMLFSRDLWLHGWIAIPGESSLDRLA
jgi:hypothetical protein